MPGRRYSSRVTSFARTSLMMPWDAALALRAAACWSEILMVTVIICQALFFSVRDIERAVTFYKENTFPEQGVTYLLHFVRML
jgi:hypothetical protein